ncbi:hypothetical protein BU15DRAFT_69285 [Melanogaster broomeanus]|nr:hypothetical protein BU15DRAFT_69285 [Melanogaster broomeanus]
MALIGKMAGSARDSGISTGELVGVSPAIGDVSTLPYAHRQGGEMSPWAYRWQDQLGIVGYPPGELVGVSPAIGHLAMALIGKMAGSARDSGISTGELVGGVPSHRACGEMSPGPTARWRDESLGQSASWDGQGWCSSARWQDQLGKVERGVPGPTSGEISPWAYRWRDESPGLPQGGEMSPQAYWQVGKAGNGAQQEDGRINY